jgi:transketolase
MSCIIDQNEVNRLEKIVREIRVDIIQMIAKAQSGHPGGSLSMVEILVSLFFKCMQYDPKNPQWEGRDRFHLSKGHGCPALYAVLAKAGYFPSSELMRLRAFGSFLQGHPHPKTPGIEVASGSLGQGLSVACGMALADRLDKKKSTIYTILGDGELQEGQIWEAAGFASHFSLDNLIVFVDRNGLQIDGKVCDIMNIEPLAKRWESFGFIVRDINGHSVKEVVSTIEDLKTVKGKPKVIIANTVKGKGVSFMENNISFHGSPPTSEEFKQALGELKGE